MLFVSLMHSVRSTVIDTLRVKPTSKKGWGGLYVLESALKANTHAHRHIKNRVLEMSTAHIAICKLHKDTSYNDGKLKSCATPYENAGFFKYQCIQILWFCVVGAECIFFLSCIYFAMHEFMVSMWRRIKKKRTEKEKKPNKNYYYTHHYALSVWLRFFAI